jgi:D-aspartate ligase
MVIKKEERDSRETEDKIQKDFVFPIIMKPENSNSSDYLNCKFDGKKKVYFFENIEQYRKVISSMNTTDYSGKMIIQEYIPGNDSAGRVVNSYSDNSGRVMVSVLGQPVLEEYSPQTLGNYAAIISRNDREITNKIADFLQKIGYVGYSNFDMKYDERRKKYMLFEINPRLGRSSFFVYGAGINMLKVMIDDVVYGRKTESRDNHKVALWTAVPKTVLMKYIKDKELKKEIKQLYPKAVRTLFYSKDRNIKRRLITARHFYSYVKQYSQHYFDKEKLGMK